MPVLHPIVISQLEKGSFFAKDNIAVFARACQNMGIDKNECLTVSMLERKDVLLLHSSHV